MEMVRLSPVALPATLEPGEYVFRRKSDRTPVMGVRLIAPLHSGELADLLEQIPQSLASFPEYAPDLS